MAPSGRTSKSAAAIAEIPDMNTQLELILAKLTALETLPAKVTALEKLLSDSNAQNLALKKQIAEKDKAIAELTAKTNSLEQYNRSWSVSRRLFVLFSRARRNAASFQPSRTATTFWRPPISFLPKHLTAPSQLLQDFTLETFAPWCSG